MGPELFGGTRSWFLNTSPVMPRRLDLETAVQC
jgi:hypothetical protein